MVWPIEPAVDAARAKCAPVHAEACPPHVGIGSPRLAFGDPGDGHIDAPCLKVRGQCGGADHGAAKCGPGIGIADHGTLPCGRAGDRIGAGAIADRGGDNGGGGYSEIRKACCQWRAHVVVSPSAVGVDRHPVVANRERRRVHSVSPRDGTDIRNGPAGLDRGEVYGFALSLEANRADRAPA